MVNISVKNIADLDINDKLVVVGIFEDGYETNCLSKNTKSAWILEKIDRIEHKQITQLKKFANNMVFYMEGQTTILKTLLIGAGNRNELQGDKIRHLGGKISLKAKELDFNKIIIPNFLETESDLELLVEGLILSLYEFNKYKEKPNTELSKSFFEEFSIDILIDGNPEKLIHAIDEIIKTVQGVFFARDLSNSPPNQINPIGLANHALSLNNGDKIKVTVLNYSELETKGLNGIISVGKGSSNEPRLIVIEYNNAKKINEPVLLVGKAVTFDTGGISLKPSEKMDEMKFDKSGGCTVLGIMKALSLLNLPINVVALIPAVENMPSGTSYRPGDIIKMFNNKSVEVLNTDAEGRLILADALAYGVSNFSPKFIIDFATLTGACIIALGTNIAGIMGNNSKLINEIILASNFTGEKMWQLPLTEEFYELIKSKIADIKNIGGRTGGAITAAAFLGHFVKDIPWAHVDIAGTAWTQDGTIDKSYNPKGSTGFGVRTIIKLLREKAS